MVILFSISFQASARPLQRSRTVASRWLRDGGMAAGATPWDRWCWMAGDDPLKSLIRQANVWISVFFWMGSVFISQRWKRSLT